MELPRRSLRSRMRKNSTSADAPSLPSQRATGRNPYAENTTLTDGAFKPSSETEVTALVEPDPNRIIGIHTDFETGLRTAIRAIDDTRAQAAKREQQIKKSFAHSGENLTPIREWEYLHDLPNESLTSLMTTLFTRAAAAQQTLATALTHLELTHQIFACVRTPTDTTTGIHDLLITYYATQTAAQAVFTPQTAYRAAIMTLRQFVADLIDLFPQGAPLRQKLAPVFNGLMAVVHGNEEKLRAEMKGIGDASEGGEDRVRAYVRCVRERFENLKGEETVLMGLAVECVDEVKGERAVERFPAWMLHPGIMHES